MTKWLVELENCGIQTVVEAGDVFSAVRSQLGERAAINLEMRPGKRACCQWIVSKVGSDTFFSIREAWP